MENAYSEKYKVETAKRLKALRNEKHISHATLKAELSEQCGLDISKDILMKYEADDIYHTSFGATSGMSVEKLFCLAKYFNVSTDYLLGNTETKSPDPQMQAACEYVGLTEIAIEAIRNIIADSTPIDELGYVPSRVKILNALLSVGFVSKLVKAFGGFIFSGIIHNENSVWLGHPGENAMRPSVWYLKSEIDDAVEAVINTIVTEFSNQQ